MPKHYAVGINSQSGRVYFNNTKTMSIEFHREFPIVPTVMLTLGNTNNSPVYRTQVTTTGFKIRFKTSYIGEVDWRASE